MADWRPATSWVSEREAAEMLRPIGLTRRRARSVLICGFAGEPVRMRGAKLYDANRVDLLLHWEKVRPAAARDELPEGLLLRRNVSVLCPWEEQAAAVADGWVMDAAHWYLMWVHQEPLPVVVTVAGFVAMGAELTGWERYLAVPTRGGPERRYVRLRLAQPGDWWARHFRGRRLQLARGNPWQLWKPYRPDVIPGEPPGTPPTGWPDVPQAWDWSDLNP